MIHASTTGDDVATHYDELDPLYRKLWGEHVHHGLWEGGRETAQKAVEALSRWVMGRTGITAGQRVCDVGCGYGATARLLAAEYGALVTGITISEKQYHGAMAHGGENPRYVLGDWLENAEADAGHDAVIAIEVLQHLPDPERGIAEMARVLVPGGRLVIAAWLLGDELEGWERRLLLEPALRACPMPGMADAEAHRRWLADAGLKIETVDDLSGKVRKTWPMWIRRTTRAFLRDPELRRFLLTDPLHHLAFAVTLLRIWIAYLTGAMRYVVFTAVRPEDGDG